MTIRIVGVTGSLRAPSKTIALVEAIAHDLANRFDADVEFVRLHELGPHLAGALTRADLPPVVEDALVAIETADVLVVASPVYRASFTGLFKHLFDFVDQYSLVDTPILLAATGGSERHALIIEHQFRPLFAFFQALTLPVGVYAHDSDFTEYRITSPRLTDRIAKAGAKAQPFIAARLAERELIERTLAAEVEATITHDARKPVRLLS
ncbi:MAG TPA: FMN reductase [Galbitalea sp.]